jgi:hypothetical protein
MDLPPAFASLEVLLPVLDKRREYSRETDQVNAKGPKARGCGPEQEKSGIALPDLRTSE